MLLTPHLAAQYAEAHFGWPVSSTRASELSGGVSSLVFLLEANGSRVVLKQSLPKLRVATEWYCPPERIHREAEALRQLRPLLPENSIPDLLSEDPPQYLFAMSAAPANAVTWKSQLMAGQCDTNIAAQTGRILGHLFAAGWSNPTLQTLFSDRSAFEQLRLDPYNKLCAQKHPTLAPALLALVREYPANCRTLVHGDWSPKNLLVAGNAVMAIDWEVIHYGDPAFDVAFLLNHLLLKSLHLPERHHEMLRLAIAFYSAVVDTMPADPSLLSRTLLHLPALLLARVDGKSPAEYLQTQSVQAKMRQSAAALLLNPAHSIQEIWQAVQ